MKDTMSLRARLCFAAVVLICGVQASGVLADAMPPHINMNVVGERFQPGVIRARVIDDTQVEKVTLFYRRPGEYDYNSIDLRKRDDIYFRELKKELGMDGVIEYYLLAQDTSGNETTEPVMDPNEAPLTTSLSDMFNQSADEVVMSSPEPGTLVVSGNQTIIVTFYKTDRQVDMGTVRIRIDDRDRTREADFVGNLIMWEPRRPMTDGVHKVEVYAKSTDGQMIGPNIWTFEVKSKLALPMGVTGNFYLGLQRDDRSKDATYVPLWNNKLDLGLRGEKDWITWDAGVMMTSEESQFLTSEDLPDRQPINRYYMNARTRHWNLRVGDSNPNFSELSLKGVLVRGLNAEFKSNRLNAQFIYGYNKRDIGEQVEMMQSVYGVTATGYYTDASMTADSWVDITSQPYQEIRQDGTTGEYHVYEFSPGTFRRNVMALKMNVSPLRNRHAVWDLGFNFFSAEDDTTTLDDYYDHDTKARYFNFQGDTDFTTGYSPKKNWVGTVETSLRFNKNRSVLSAEFGGTMVTDNLYGVVTEEIKDEIPDTIDDGTFRINGSTQTSFDKMKLDESVSKGISDALFSVYKFRFLTPLPIPRSKTTVKAEAYRIPTHYVSLGNPHQKTDMGGYKLNLKTRVLQDQVSFNVDYDTYSDNLDDERMQYASKVLADGTQKQKALTKDTSVSSFSVNLRPRILQKYQPFASLGYRMYTSANDLDLAILDDNGDSVNNKANKIDMDSNTIMASLGGVLPVGLQEHRGTLSFTNMDIADNRPVEVYDKNDSQNLTVMVNTNSTFGVLPLAVNASIGQTTSTTYAKLGAGTDADPYKRKQVDTGITMLNLSASYKWFRDKRFKTTVGMGYIGSSNSGPDTYKVDNVKTSLRFEADYKFSRMASVGGMVKYINFTDDVNKGMDYTEPIVGVDIRSNF